MDAFDRLAPLDDAYASRSRSRTPSTGGRSPRACRSATSGTSWPSDPIRRADADEARLCAFDDRAHAEAAAAPGLRPLLQGSDRGRWQLPVVLPVGQPGRRPRRGRPPGPPGGGRAHPRDVRATTRSNSCACPDRDDGSRLRFEPYDAAPRAGWPPRQRRDRPVVVPPTTAVTVVSAADGRRLAARPERSSPVSSSPSPIALVARRASAASCRRPWPRSRSRSCSGSSSARSPAVARPARSPRVWRSRRSASCGSGSSCSARG